MGTPKFTWKKDAKGVWRRVYDVPLTSMEKWAERARIAAETAASSAKIAARNKKVREAIAATKAAAKRIIEKKKAGTSWVAEKDEEVKAVIKEDVKKYGYGAKPKPKAVIKPRPPVVPKVTGKRRAHSISTIPDVVSEGKPMISRRLVIVGMVGIGAATLYFMRKKK